MKLTLYSNEYFYQKLHEFYSEIDEDDNIIQNDFDRNYPDIFHINDGKFINYSINGLDGFRDLTHVILQKSQFKNPILLRILNKFKVINPQVKVVLYMDDDPIYYEVLLSRIAKKNLCYVATTLEELDQLFTNDFSQDLSHHILKKETRKLLKEFRRY